MYKLTDIDDYQNRITEDQAKVLVEHCNERGIFPDICAWYEDMEDFYQDWIYDNRIYRTKDEAYERFEDGIDSGEFVEFETGEIVRLSV